MIGDPTRAIALTGIAAITLAALIGPFASHPAYSSVRHSLSELAGQNMPNAWIMRGGFAVFGGAVLAASLIRWRSDPLAFGALAIFGIGMLAAAIWSHLPIAPVAGGSIAEDDLHSIAATAMGLAFAATCCARLWTQRSQGLDWLSVGGLLISITIPIMMMKLPDVAGLMQRMMFLFSFIWIYMLVKSSQIEG